MALDKLKRLFHQGNVKPVLSSRSPKWSELRTMWLTTQPVCQGCGTEKNLQVHHIVPVHVDPSRELDQTNLITLCELVRHDCHFHLGHLLNWKAYNPNVEQDTANFKHAVETRPYCALLPVPTPAPALPTSPKIITPSPLHQQPPTQLEPSTVDENTSATADKQASI